MLTLKKLFTALSTLDFYSETEKFLLSERDESGSMDYEVLSVCFNYEGLATSYVLVNAANACLTFFWSKNQRYCAISVAEGFDWEGEHVRQAVWALEEGAFCDGDSFQRVASISDLPTLLSDIASNRRYERIEQADEAILIRTANSLGDSLLLAVRMSPFKEALINPHRYGPTLINALQEKGGLVCDAVGVLTQASEATQAVATVQSLAAPIISSPQQSSEADDALYLGGSSPTPESIESAIDRLSAIFDENRWVYLLNQDLGIAMGFHKVGENETCIIFVNLQQRQALSYQQAITEENLLAIYATYLLLLSEENSAPGAFGFLVNKLTTGTQLATITLEGIDDVTPLLSITKAVAEQELPNAVVSIPSQQAVSQAPQVSQGQQTVAPRQEPALDLVSLLLADPKLSEIFNFDGSLILNIDGIKKDNIAYISGTLESVLSIFHHQNRAIPMELIDIFHDLNYLFKICVLEENSEKNCVALYAGPHGLYFGFRELFKTKIMKEHCLALDFLKQKFDGDCTKIRQLLTPLNFPTQFSVYYFTPEQWAVYDQLVAMEAFDADCLEPWLPPNTAPELETIPLETLQQVEQRLSPLVVQRPALQKVLMELQQWILFLKGEAYNQGSIINQAIKQVIATYQTMISEQWNLATKESTDHLSALLQNDRITLKMIWCIAIRDRTPTPYEAQKMGNLWFRCSGNPPCIKQKNLEGHPLFWTLTHGLFNSHTRAWTIAPDMPAQQCRVILDNLTSYSQALQPYMNVTEARTTLQTVVNKYGEIRSLVNCTTLDEINTKLRSLLTQYSGVVDIGGNGQFITAITQLAQEHPLFSEYWFQAYNTLKHLGFFSQSRFVFESLWDNALRAQNTLPFQYVQNALPGIDANLAHEPWLAAPRTYFKSILDNQEKIFSLKAQNYPQLIGFLHLQIQPLTREAQERLAIIRAYINIIVTENTIYSAKGNEAYQNLIRLGVFTSDFASRSLPGVLQAIAQQAEAAQIAAAQAAAQQAAAAQAAAQQAGVAQAAAQVAELTRYFSCPLTPQLQANPEIVMTPSLATFIRSGSLTANQIYQSCLRQKQGRPLEIEDMLKMDILFCRAEVLDDLSPEIKRQLKNLYARNVLPRFLRYNFYCSVELQEKKFNFIFPKECQNQASDFDFYLKSLRHSKCIVDPSVDSSTSRNQLVTISFDQFDQYLSYLFPQPSMDDIRTLAGYLKRFFASKNVFQWFENNPNNYKEDKCGIKTLVSQLMLGTIDGVVNFNELKKTYDTLIQAFDAIDTGLFGARSFSEADKSEVQKLRISAPLSPRWGLSTAPSVSGSAAASVPASAADPLMRVVQMDPM